MLRVSEHKARPRIGRALATVAAALLCATALGQPNPAFAGPHGGGGGGGFHGGGGGGFHGGGFGGFHGGGFHGGGFGGFHGVGGFHGGFAGLHHGFGERHERFRGGIGFGFFGYPYGWDYSPDYSYYGYSQPYSSQTWYYCWDPAGYYPYVTQCNTGWQAVSG
jgi:hypothetical protein